MEKTYKKYENNKDVIKQRNSTYRRDNKEKRNASDTKRRANDPNYKLRVYVSADVLIGLKRNNGSKMGQSTFEHVGYTVEELKEHLEKQFEPWMSWDNHGNYDPKTWDDNDPSTWTWHIDHIIPHSTFKYSSMEDLAFKDCWALSNLRPLSAKHNIINGSRLERKRK